MNPNLLRNYNCRPLLCKCALAFSGCIGILYNIVPIDALIYTPKLKYILSNLPVLIRFTNFD